MSKIKILYLINALDVGGAEKMLLDLCRFLPKEKYEIAVGTVMGGGPLEADYKAAGVKLFIYTKKSKLGLDVIRNFRKIIKEFNPDIIHTHLLSADTWGRIAAMLEGGKVIVTTEHNRNVEEGAFVKSLKHFLSFFTTKIIASSNAIKEYQIKKELIGEKSIEVIPYGIDLKKFPFRGVKVVRYGEPVTLITMGRLTYQKNQKLLIEAAAKFHNDDDGIKVKIAGDGPMKDKLNFIANDLHVQNEVELVGLQNAAEFMKSGDFFVLPSVYEGLGIVLLEAMAIGTPVIAADIPAVNEIVIDEETGILFESENSDDLIKRLNQLLKNPDLQETIIKNGRKLVEDKFTVERMVSEYDNLYQRIK